MSPQTSYGKCLIIGQTHLVHRTLSRDPLIPHMESIGDMVFFKILGQPFLVLGSVERTFDIFEKRSSNYSDRPHFPMLDDMLVFSLFLLSVYVESRSSESRMDYTWNMAFQRYGLRWRNHRRTFHDYFHPNIVHKYQSVQIATTRVLLRCLLGSPDDFMQHIR